MIGTTDTAKRLLPFFEGLARHANIGSSRVKLHVSKKQVAPEAVGDTIRLPDLSDEPRLFVRSFLHELRHVRDVLDGFALQLSEEEMEARARRAERTISPAAVDMLLKRHAALFQKDAS
jgi:hypothetical protein